MGAWDNILYWHGKKKIRWGRHGAQDWSIHRNQVEYRRKINFLDLLTSKGRAGGGVDEGN